MVAATNWTLNKITSIFFYICSCFIYTYRRNMKVYPLFQGVYILKDSKSHFADKIGQKPPFVTHKQTPLTKCQSWCLSILPSCPCLSLVGFENIFLTPACYLFWPSDVASQTGQIWFVKVPKKKWKIFGFHTYIRCWFVYIYHNSW